MKTITPEKLYQQMNTQAHFVILDVRAEEKYNEFHIDGQNIDSININKSEIFELEENDSKETIPSLEKDAEIIVTCTTGNSATKCGKILSERDYNVTVLEGGITAWKEYLNEIKSEDK